MARNALIIGLVCFGVFIGSNEYKRRNVNDDNKLKKYLPNIGIGIGLFFATGMFVEFFKGSLGYDSVFVSLGSPIMRISSLIIIGIMIFGKGPNKGILTFLFMLYILAFIALLVLSFIGGGTGDLYLYY